MKPIIRKILLWLIASVTLLTVLAFIVDIFIMPWYVNSVEVVVPNTVGINRDEATKILLDSNLNAIVEGPRYSDEFPIDQVIYQKPEAGSIVKENRRVYIVISGGNPLTIMPYLLDKTLRDAKVSIERMGFVLGNVTEVKSESKANTIVEQYPKEGTNLQKGTKVNLKISVGPNIGMVRVPDLLGKSFGEAKSILQNNSLIVGKINYQDSRTLLPNTVLTQYPTKNKLVNIGEPIDLFITKSQN
jgi:eukaryotic-like serine/threonine-protein kinase